MIKLSKPVIVEGKYDKIKVASVAEGIIVETDGFGVFSHSEKAALIRRLAEKNGVIVLTDSDGAGLVIRNYIKNLLPPEKVTHLYTPEVKGKERRKKAPSKAGLLGVEGIDADWLREALAPYAADAGTPPPCMCLTKADLFAIGLSGGDCSAEKRKKLALLLDLPQTLSASALLEAVNLTVSEEEWLSALAKLKESEAMEKGKRKNDKAD